MGKAIKLDTIERAYAICKRYAILAKKADVETAKGRKKYELLYRKMYDSTWHTLMNTPEWLSIPTTMLHSLIIAAVNNGKTKQAVITALEAVGYEIL